MSSRRGFEFSQRGLSMVELMVAMTLGLLLTTAVLQTFIGAKRTYIFQQELSRVQENGRFAMSFLTRAIRQADFWGCLKDGSRITSILNPTAGVTLSQGISSANGVASYTPALGPLPDLIALRGGREGGIAVVNTASSAALSLSTLQHPSGASVTDGDILLVADCERASLFQATGTNQNNRTVSHNPGIGTPGNATQSLGFTYGTDATVYEASAQRFWIRSSALSGEPVLVRGDDHSALSGGNELVEGIENLQLILGYDANRDGVVDFYAPPGQGDDDDVISVQVSLVARSLRNNVVDTAVPLEYNGSSYAPAAGDRYLRKVFTSNIMIRNRQDD